jgi:hypothetical protein
MSHLKKFFEFMGEKSEEIASEQEMMGNVSGDLMDALNKMKETGGEIEWNGYRISAPSEINGPDQPTKYLIVSQEGQHAQAQSEEEVEEVVTEQILFESFKQRTRLRKKK